MASGIARAGIATLVAISAVLFSTGPAQASGTIEHSTTAPRDSILGIINDIATLTPGDPEAVFEALPLMAELDIVTASNPAVMDPLMRARVKAAHHRFGIIRLNQPNPAHIATIRGNALTADAASRAGQAVRAIEENPTLAFLKVSPRRNWPMAKRKLFVERVLKLARQGGLIPEQVKVGKPRNREAVAVFGVLPPESR